VLTACQKAESQPAQGPPPAPPVSVAAAIEKEVKDWDEFTGRLEAVEKVDVRPRVSGYIERVHLKQGAEVKKGDLLFEIDARPYQAEFKRTQAELERARAQLQQAKNQLERTEQLMKSKFVSKEAYDDKVSAQREAAAGVAASQAAVEAAKLNVGYTKIYAPIDGRAGRAEITLGNLVSGGTAGEATMLTTIVSLDPIYAYFEGDEQIYLKYVALARGGERPSSRTTKNPIFMGLSNEEGHPHEGYMDFVDNQLNPATGTIRARAVFPNKDRLFTPGLFARLKLVGSGTYKAVLINDRAVGTDQSKKFVLVVGEDKKAMYREIKLGPTVDGLRVVKQGLKGGEMIVVNGLQRVRPGTPVAPEKVPMENQPEKAAAAPQETKTQ
jgi:RND family efflux transporter MFP subunit